jgi:hypothetical protein
MVAVQGRYTGSICVVLAHGSIQQKPLRMKILYAVRVGTVVQNCAAQMMTISLIMLLTILEITPLKAVMASLKGKLHVEVSLWSNMEKMEKFHLNV